MKTNIEIIKEKALTIIGNVKDIKEQMDEASEWNSLGEIISNIGKLNALIMDIILAVELVANDAIDDLEDLKSSDKLEAAVQIIDDLTNLPFWLELVDAHVFRLVISVLVEVINSKFGNAWNLDIVRDAIEKGVSFIKRISDVVDSVAGD